jgi:hypothetical protein
VFALKKARIRIIAVASGLAAFLLSAGAGFGLR